MDVSAKFFNANLKLLHKINPKLAFLLTMVDPKGLHFSKTQNEEINLYRDYKGQRYLYHSESDPNKEAVEWFQKLKLSSEQVLYVYGTGLGYIYEAAKEWLQQDKNRAIVFIEEDLAVLYRLFETKQGSHLLKNPQVRIIYLPNLDETTLLNELTWTYFSTPFRVTHLPLYQKMDSDKCLALAELIAHQAAQKITFVDEYLHYGVSFFRNFYPNLLSLPGNFFGNQLFNQFKNTPAIICGAGPSLNKNIDLLKTLSNRALIFSGSSSLNALVPKGIIPHFGIGIDPNSAQMARIIAIKDFQIPFFYRSRFFHDALELIKGPHLYLTGSSGYEVPSWFDRELGLPSETEENLDEGHNVVNFSIEIAKSLGCNPIILVGVDLALTNQEHYADGVLTSLNVKESELNYGKDFESQPIVKPDIFGKPVQTFWKWITEAKWTSDYSRDHPEVTLINATEGGIGFEGISNRSLSDVAKEYLLKEENLYEKVREKIAAAPLPNTVTKKRIVELMQQLKTSLDHSEQLIDSLHREMVKMLRMKHLPENLQTTQSALAEVNLDQEIAYQNVLEVFNTVFLSIKKREIFEIQNLLSKRTKKTRDRMKLKLNVKRLQFLKEVCHFHTQLINLYFT